MINPKTISYSLLIGDLFHIGHLKMLETARNSAEYHICGVITDEIIVKWVPPLICSFEERKEVIDKIKYVDETMPQNSLDPTENLEKIHTRFPDAKILLIQNHILGGSSILGVEYIKQINGEVIPHKFYSNLSREFIRNVFLKDFAQSRNLSRISVSDIKIGDFDYFKKHFSTKANTIKNLRQILKSAIIEKEFIFSVKQWENDKKIIVKTISQIFTNVKIVIRSSSLSEDSIEYSNAGHFESVLNVDSSNPDEIQSAVEIVVSSYLKGDHYSKENQVLVQKQTNDVMTSGVLFTRNLWSNTPYYLINYDDKSSKTDTVTSGLANGKIEILNDLPLEIVIPKWHNLIAAIREIEFFFQGLTLDIEFAVKTTGEVVIFQVRPLAANTRFCSIDDGLIKQKIAQLQKQYSSISNSFQTNDSLFNNELYLSDMAFWNPAELIGDRPNYLDYSLFNHILMKSNWNQSLTTLGYTKIDKPLMVLIGNKPYINIYNSFLCLLPQNLPFEIKKKLIEFYHNKIHEHPELHDKIEFEIVHNCYRFDYDIKAVELYKSNFSEVEIITIKESLIDITNNILLQYDQTISEDNKSISELERRYNKINSQYTPGQTGDLNIYLNDDYSLRQKFNTIYQLIEDCFNLGAKQFSRVARMAFIGNSLMRSLRDIDIISEKDFIDFMSSVSTVATEMDKDFKALRTNVLPIETFLNKYGHLRPGTYDITKLPYNKKISYISSETSDTVISSYNPQSGPIDFNEVETRLGPQITEACKKHGIKSTGLKILNFAKKTIELREYYKFIYTKNISLALEIIAGVGEELGFCREQLSNLDYYTIVGGREFCSKEETISIWGNLIMGRLDEKRIEMQVSLPPLIFSELDFVQVPSYIATPNYVTDSIVSGEVVLPDKMPGDVNINDKIVVIEKADPGYDWIFTKKIKALITKYGGAASHMAIRCAEFNIPAAIGCGEIIFTQVTKSESVLLDCRNKRINSI
jgi:glutamine kinase